MLGAVLMVMRLILILSKIGAGVGQHLVLLAFGRFGQQIPILFWVLKGLSYFLDQSAQCFQTDTLRLLAFVLLSFNMLLFATVPAVMLVLSCQMVASCFKHFNLQEEWPKTSACIERIDRFAENIEDMIREVEGSPRAPRPPEAVRRDAIEAQAAILQQFPELDVQELARLHLEPRGDRAV